MHIYLSQTMSHTVLSIWSALPSGSRNLDHWPLNSSCSPIHFTFWISFLYKTVSSKNFHLSLQADQKRIMQALLILGVFNFSGKNPLQTTTKPLRVVFSGNWKGFFVCLFFVCFVFFSYCKWSYSWGPLLLISFFVLREKVPFILHL